MFFSWPRLAALLLASLLLLQAAHAQPQTQLRALSVQLNGKPLAERIDAYQSGYQVLLPLGELAGLLGLDITVHAAAGSASGTLRADRQRFELNMAEARVRIGERELSFEPRLATVIGNEIYVSTQLLMRWLPINLAVDLPTWALQVKPREPLPAPPAVATAATRAPAPRSQREIEASLLVLEVQMDDQTLSDSFSAYQDGAQILLPLGELARLLGIAIQVRASQGSASGLLLREDRSFALNLAESLVALNGREQGFEPRLAMAIGDDIYVSTQLLTRWLPIDLKVKLSTAPKDSGLVLLSVCAPAVPAAASRASATQRWRGSVERDGDGRLRIGARLLADQRHRGHQLALQGAAQHRRDPDRRQCAGPWQLQRLVQRHRRLPVAAHRIHLPRTSSCTPPFTDAAWPHWPCCCSPARRWPT